VIVRHGSAALAKVAEPSERDSVGSDHAIGRLAESISSVVPLSSARQHPAEVVDWRRIAAPQVDLYDTSVTLKYAASRGYRRSTLPLDDRTNASFFDGAVEMGKRPTLDGPLLSRAGYPSKYREGR
jgi:hypothetical protein